MDISPHIFRPGYTLRRHFIDEFHLRYVPTLPSGSRVLDLGGVKTLKRGIFDIERYDLRVIYVNLSPVKRPDILGNAEHLPFTDKSFDVVICSELLEHVWPPINIISEAYRVLCRGGSLLICVPFLYRIHADPYDFGRYTDYFWRCTLEEVGFQDIILERQGLFFSVLADFGKQYLNEVGIGRPFQRAAYWLMLRFQNWALKYEQQHNIKEHQFLRSFTTGFGIVSKK